MTGRGILHSKISEIYKLVEGLQGRLNSASKEESDFLSKTFEELKAHLKEFSLANEENERHLNEAERKARELAATISSIADGVITYGPNGEITSMNRAARELLGVSSKGFNSMTAIERMRLMKVKTADSEEQEPGQSPLVRALNGETVRGEVRVIENPRDGRVVWTDNSAAPMYSADGRLQGVVTTFTDITERKRIEEELRKSEEKSRDLIRHAPSGIFEMDLHGPRFKSVNDVMCQYLGYNREELLSMHPFDLLDDKSKIIFQERIRKKLAGENIDDSVEYKVLAKDEREYYAVLHVTFTYKDGKPEGAMVIAHDITERKRAEDALLESEKELRLVADGVPLLLAHISFELKYLFVNQSYADWFHLSKEEIIGRHISEILSPEGYKGAQPAIKKVLSGEKATFYLVVQREGQPRSLDISFIPQLDENGAVWSYYTITQDITEHKLMEKELCRARDELEQRVQERTAELSHSREELEVVNEELQVELTQHERLEKDLIAAKEAAEEAARIKAAFMANMSHELRTPMNAVIGMTSLLLDEKLTPEQKDYVETIRSGGESLMALINDILDFSKMEREKTEIELQDINLRQCVEEALELLAKNASEKDLDLAYIFEEGMPEAIIGDPARLRQVLVNLLGNAIKFTDHGEVILTVAPEQNGMIHFSVRDTGIGIPSDKMKLLFLPFCQVDPSMTRGYDGAGLGLAICKKIVELMGGEIWVQSDPGKGSTFHFTIRGEAVSARPKPFFGARPQLEGKSVLIIEDKRATRRILGQQILSWDMIPTIASSTLEVPKLVRGENAYDAVILDVNMSGAGDLVEEIRKRGLPLIALTSVGQHAGIKFAASISKPVKPSQIYSALSKILHQKAQKLQAIETEEKTDYGPLRILLAEDSASNRKVTLQMLRKLGYSADVVANGAEAVEALKRQQYDLILMDVKMPVMNGIEATREIRRLWPDNGPKIVALTAYALAGDREKCLEAGMDGYLSKPVQLNDMADILAQ
jgi:PAS domain S-box-containing protein